MKFLASFVVLSALIAAPAQGVDGYVPMTDPAEVRTILSDGAFLYRKVTDAFYRSDGNMVEFNRDYDLMSVRKWDVAEDARVCWYVFAKPDRLIDCFVLHRAEESSDQYYVVWPEGAGYPIETVPSVPPELIEELERVAGGM